MKIFIDTSSLFKLYHREADTEIIENIFSRLKVTNIYLSEITKIEFASTIWKKVRTKEITELDAKTTLDLFETDCIKYTFISTNSIILEQARVLTSKYGINGLRTLDSIQLSSAITLKSAIDLYITSDKLLKTFFETEGLATSLPSN